MPGEDQGRAVGDMLENLVNGLARMAGLTTPDTLLVGSPYGNTWTQKEDDGLYTGRDSLYEVVDQLTELYADLAGKLNFTRSPASAEDARTSFAGLLSLLYLSPVRLAGTQVDTVLGGMNQELYAQWQRDNATPQAQLDEGYAYFTDAFLVNARYDLTVRSQRDGDEDATGFDHDTAVYIDALRGVTVRRHQESEADRYIVFGSDAGDTQLSSSANADHLFAGGSDDVVIAGSGDDYLEGGAGIDTLYGEAGDDTLEGGIGGDLIDGGADDDDLRGGDGSDQLYGGRGDDLLSGGRDAESLFRTCKYRPNYPSKPFESIEKAQQWTLSFVQWYNHQHKHSGLKFVTPAQRHDGSDAAILNHRKQVYEAAKQRHPERWTGTTRDWGLKDEVWLNPERKPPEELRKAQSTLNRDQL